VGFSNGFLPVSWIEIKIKFAGKLNADFQFCASGQAMDFAQNGGDMGHRNCAF